MDIQISDEKYSFGDTLVRMVNHDEVIAQIREDVTRSVSARAAAKGREPTAGAYRQAIAEVLGPEDPPPAVGWRRPGGQGTLTEPLACPALTSPSLLSRTPTMMFFVLLLMGCVGLVVSPTATVCGVVVFARGWEANRASGKLLGAGLVGISLGAPVWLLFGPQPWRSPAAILTEVLGGPPPASAVVLHASDDWGLSPRSWAHFKIAPSDLASLLASQPFAEKDRFSNDFSSLGPPDWWAPAMLGNDAVEWEWRLRIDEEVEKTRRIWVNAKKDEAFAVCFSDD